MIRETYTAWLLNELLRRGSPWPHKAARWTARGSEAILTDAETGQEYRITVEPLTVPEARCQEEQHYFPILAAGERCLCRARIARERTPGAISIEEGGPS